jgi:hypothetical protein
VAEARQRDGQLQAQNPRRHLLDTLPRRLPLLADWLRRSMLVVGHPLVVAEANAEPEVARQPGSRAAQERKKSRPSGPGRLVVAGTGCEPVTFGSWVHRLR